MHKPKADILFATYTIGMLAISLVLPERIGEYLWLFWVSSCAVMAVFGVGMIYGMTTLDKRRKREKEEPNLDSLADQAFNACLDVNQERISELDYKLQKEIKAQKPKAQVVKEAPKAHWADGLSKHEAKLIGDVLHALGKMDDMVVEDCQCNQCGLIWAHYTARGKPVSTVRADQPHEPPLTPWGDRHPLMD